MIIKKKDPIEPQVKQLEELLTTKLNQAQKKAITTELKNVRAGAKGENSSAYFIDFHCGETKNWAVLHDLRIEYKGKVAQIDHLLINRALDVYILETKNYQNGIKITEDGDFHVLLGRSTRAIESPIEQNKRHIFLLKKIINDTIEILPTRLGIAIRPAFLSYVLVSPTSKVIRPPKKKFDTTNVIKSDTFYTMIQKNIDTMSPIKVGKLIGRDTLKTFAKKLAALHKPGNPPDYTRKFGIRNNTEQPKKTQEQPQKTVKPEKQHHCEDCKKPITEKAAAYCLDNKARFKGKIYCFKCQRKYRASKA